MHLARCMIATKPCYGLGVLRGDGITVPACRARAGVALLGGWCFGKSLVVVADPPPLAFVAPDSSRAVSCVAAPAVPAVVVSTHGQLSEAAACAWTGAMSVYACVREWACVEVLMCECGVDRLLCLGSVSTGGGMVVPVLVAHGLAVSASPKFSS